MALVSADVLLSTDSGITGMAVPSGLTSYFPAGNPVVAATGADSTTVGEVEAGGAELLVPPGRPAELVDAVLDLARRPDTVLGIAVRGQEPCDSLLGEARQWLSAPVGSCGWATRQPLLGDVRSTADRRFLRNDVEQTSSSHDAARLLDHASAVRPSTLS